MAVLEKKIDFALVFSVKNANPNGDPSGGNMPRITLDERGEVSDVCLKRKIRNQLMESGENIFVQSDDNRNDDCKTLKARAEKFLKDVMKNEDALREKSCGLWIDVRAFGQVFAYKGSKTGSGISVGVRGPVTIHPAFSIEPVNVTSTQITKSVSGESEKDKENKKSSDTMGMKHRVDFGVYVTYGSINPQLASKTGFSYEDAQKIKQALLHIFDNDASSARPEGSMEVIALYWWEHSSKSGQYSSAKVHRSLYAGLKKDAAAKPPSADDYEYTVTQLEGLTPEIHLPA
jgi:CRISPR-associated protein Csd2